MQAALDAATSAQAVMLSTYVIYVGVSLGITFWVGRTLNRNGRVFLVSNSQCDCFGGGIGGKCV